MTELERYIDALRYERLMWKARYFDRVAKDTIRSYIELYDHGYHAVAERIEKKSEKANKIAKAYERMANRIKEKQNEKR